MLEAIEGLSNDDSIPGARAGDQRTATCWSWGCAVSVGKTTVRKCCSKSQGGGADGIGWARTGIPLPGAGAVALTVTAVRGRRFRSVRSASGAPGRQSAGRWCGCAEGEDTQAFKLGADNTRTSRDAPRTTEAERATPCPQNPTLATGQKRTRRSDKSSGARVGETAVDGLQSAWVDISPMTAVNWLPTAVVALRAN